VIDFGTCGVGDPSCDLAIAWTLFEGGSRDTFRACLAADEATWARGRGWALWKALIIAAGHIDVARAEIEESWQVIDAVLINRECQA
ncbi:phosphotransferase, partial [Mesorhizobium sp. M1C.F.Ca.ET.187.01.1.1]